jgi:phage shock protein PspC (stress-responsive transcriptional regulator)
MQASQPSLFAREDTFFGVCAGLGEDFGFSPTYLRVAFAAFLFFNPLAAIGTYAVAGAIVALSRLLAPHPRPAAAAPQAEAAAAQDPAEAGDRVDLEPLAVAA